MTLTVSERLSRLERAVTELQQRAEMATLLPLEPKENVADAAAELASISISTAELAPTAETRPTAQPKRMAAPAQTGRSEFWTRFRSGEFLIALLGIGLLLFGVAILFRYAIDQGWITPAVRLGIGYGIGSTLFSIGYWMRTKRPIFSQILTGGGIGAWYITAFAGYFSLDLISYPVALVSMSITTLTAYSVAVRRRNQIFAHIGLLGGFLTPFVLPVETPSIPGLLAYTTIVATVGMGIYFAFRWSAVLILAAAGAWSIYLIALVGLAADSPALFSIQSEQRWPFQLAALFNLLAFTLVPIVRTLITVREANATTTLESNAEEDSQERSSNLIPWYVHLSTVVSPFLVTALSADFWNWEPSLIGIVTLSLAAVYAGISWGFTANFSAQVRPLAQTHALVAALFLSWSISAFFEGDVEFMLFSLQAVALMAIGTRWGKSSLIGLGHLLYATLGLLYIVRLFEPVDGFAFVNGIALAHVVYILSGCGITWLSSNRTVRNIYGLVLHFVVLAWFAREAYVYSQAAITILWAVYAIGLLVCGLVLNKSILRQIGLGTILLVVAKLFIIDLAEVETLIRILLFIGLGVVLLLISYFFRPLWQKEEVNRLEQPNPTHQL